jgi:Tol biopolymer transport system component
MTAHPEATGAGGGPVIPAALTLLLVACGGDGSTSPTESSNPVPSLMSTVPQLVMASGAAFTLMVEGSDFVSSSVVRWNGADRPTTYVDEATLQARITGTDIAAEGMAAVTVYSPSPAGGESEPVNVGIIAGAAGPIVFDSWRDSDGNGEIYVMNPDGTDQVRLTTSPEWDIWPLWSPDGSKIAFESTRDGDFEVYVMNTDGSGQVNVTNAPGTADAPDDWSPDGSRIVITRGWGAEGEVFVVNADGSEPVNLTDSPGFDGAADWSPDGSKIAFTSDRSGTDEIYVMNPDGSDVAGLTTATPEEAFWPVWSPDGTKIAFSSEQDGTREIYVMNADGSGVLNLTDSPSFDGEPAWSPDGSKLAFTTNRDGNYEIYIVAADGSDMVNLTNSTGDEWRPSWSADGRWIAFEYSFDGGYEEIYVMSVDGRVRARLTWAQDSDRGAQWRP